MLDYYRLLYPLIRHVDAETAHHAAIRALKCGVVPPSPAIRDERLSQILWGLRFENPVGMAAGFDKNAEVVAPLFRQGFGFVEAGTVTPRPQAGNPRPRLFRLDEDRAIINRMGFNNEGIEAFEGNLRKAQGAGIIGANIGKNKDTEDPIADYVALLPIVYPLCSYVTVNISSPNTPGLRALQAEEPLRALVIAVMSERDMLASQYGVTRPVLVKIAPDLSQEELEVIVGVAREVKVDGLIISNTTVSRPALRSRYREEGGGLSGAPLSHLALDTLRRAYPLVGGAFPLVGVGGIASAEEAYARIRAGAHLVQVYSALIYHGFGLVRRIQEGLIAYMARDGFRTIAEAVGADHA